MMADKIDIRIALKPEIGWINHCYDQVEFVHSNFEHETIAVAEFQGQKAGLGRLVRIDETNLELGGMFVFEEFRGKGIAREIVQFLLSHAKPAQTVYCIPFQHLVPFYEQMGFTPCSTLESIPSKILEKYQWCQEKYAHPTALLVCKIFNPGDCHASTAVLERNRV
ncbi:MAG TPA: GNAT family N-acetyltransferase [Rhabdochlamydiaceae bacterium]|jgi:GNAT superfamily N-acetyltransferase|nr:GNAT family N-acetyltransferase [Rhabdochlamydiaceae bacterium]